MFTVGSGDVTTVYKDWTRKFQTLSQTSITYSSLSMDFAQETHAECLLVSYHPSATEIVDGKFRVLNKKKPNFKNNTGIWYHLTEILYCLQLSVLAYRHGVQVIVVDSGTTHWFAWTAAALAGIEIVPNFHNVYHPTKRPPTKKVQKIVMLLDGWFFKNFTKTALGVSPECGKQYLALAKTPKRFIGYFAQFSAADFASLKPIDTCSAQLNILYVGRVEENKGVFDLVTIAQQLQTHHYNFTMTVCGDGDALQALKEKVASSGLADKISLRGTLNRTGVLEAYANAHIVIIPTRSTFSEGLPKACAEAALAGRAIVTSELANAADIFSDAIIEAEPDRPESFANAIEKLFNDRELLKTSAARAKAAAAVFVNADNSLRAALHRALSA